jgi:hypothetical protein
VCVRVMLWEAELSCADWRGVDVYSNGAAAFAGEFVRRLLVEGDSWM